jgi:amidase
MGWSLAVARRSITLFVSSAFADELTLFRAAEVALALEMVDARMGVDPSVGQAGGSCLGAIAGSDPMDPTARPDAVPDLLARLRQGQGLGGMRIGVDTSWNSDGVDDATDGMISAAIEVFRSLGASIEPVTFPDARQTVHDWIPVCAVEAAVAHEAAFPDRRSDYGPALSGLIETGRALLAIDHQKVVLRRNDFCGRVGALLATVDVLLAPVQPLAALAAAPMHSWGEQPDLLLGLLRFTCPFNMAGVPTITLPGGFTVEGIPMAFQLAAADMQEATLVRAGAAFQDVTSWHRRHPIA